MCLNLMSPLTDTVPSSLLSLSLLQVIALLQGGEAYRHVGTTDMNQKSSRAHTLFKLIIESKALAGEANSGAAGSSGK